MMRTIAVDYTCKKCEDTHVIYSYGLERDVMCVYCPVPCRECAVNGNGAYCSQPRCDCNCHKAISIKPFLHVYPQTSWHEEAHIIGDIKSLIKLRDAITKVIDGDSAACAYVTAADGESYKLIVANKENGEELILPYQHSTISKDGKHPHEIIDDDIYMSFFTKDD